MTDKSDILLTGVSSRIGACSLVELLENTDSRIWLMLRKHPEHKDLWERVDDAIRLQKKSIDLPKYKGRLRPFWGDLRKRHLGIKDEVFDEMCQSQIGQIIHLASLSRRQEFSKDALLKTNFEGTNRLINLAARIQAKNFLHLGWLYAFSGRNPKDKNSSSYLDYMESVHDFYNLKEFVQQITAQNVIKRCDDLKMNWQIICPAYFLDVEHPREIEKRWYFLVIKLITDLFEEYKSLGKKPPIRLIFPSSEVPISLCRPEYAARFILHATQSPLDFSRKIIPVAEDKISVRQLLEIASKTHGGIHLKFTESVQNLPFLEKVLMKQSLIFFEYLFHHKYFPGLDESFRLAQKFGFEPRVFSNHDLESLAKISISKARHLQAQHRLTRIGKIAQKMLHWRYS